MSSTPPFPGFSEPSENYFRLPNNWFTLLTLLRQAHGDRIAAPLKMLEYLLKHTWGASKFDGSICLSADEIRNGRRGRDRRRLDAGTGLSENTIRIAGEVLAKIGFIQITQDTKDRARRLRTYQIRLAEAHPEDSPSAEFNGFELPKENYFKVSKNWTDLTRGTNSAATIVIVEYLFRHTWGYQNLDGKWLSAEEIANGRMQVTSGQRYDAGTGFDLVTIYRALNEALALKLITFRDQFEDGINTREFNLRLEDMQTDPEGRWLGKAICTTEAVICTTEVVTCTIEDVDCTNTLPPICTTEEVICAVEADGGAVEAVDVANEARSVKDTHQDTHEKKPEKTQTSRLGAKIKKQKDVVVFPENILAGLEKIEWADTTDEIGRIYACNPELVETWLNFALHTDHIQKSRAGLFRIGIRSGEFPPYGLKIPAQNDVSDDDAEELEPVSPEPDSNIAPEAAHAWDAVLRQLQTEMPRALFNTWVRETHVVGYAGNLLAVAAGNPDARDWLESRVQSTVKRLLAGILNQPVEIQFVVPDQLLKGRLP